MHKSRWAFVFVFAVALAVVAGCGSHPKETVSVIDENHFDQLASVPGETQGNAAGGIEVLADGTIPAGAVPPAQIPMESANAPIAATQSAAQAMPSGLKESAPKGASFEQKVQTALKNAGYYTGSADGKIGPKTREAIKTFQTASGLKADGVVGPTTWEKLKKYVGSSASSSTGTNS